MVFLVTQRHVPLPYYHPRTKTLKSARKHWTLIFSQSFLFHKRKSFKRKRIKVLNETLTIYEDYLMQPP